MTGKRKLAPVLGGESPLDKLRAPEDWAAHVSNEIVVLADPMSPAAEAVRSLQSQIQQQFLVRGLRSFAIIGDAPGSGATFTAANLAVCCAQAGRRTALVDANFSAPRLASILGFGPDELGLADWLRGREDIHQSSRFGLEPLPNLSFIPAGRPPYEAHLLHQPRLTAAMMDLARLFDVVIYDAPAATELADALTIAGGAERTILVGREQKTELSVLQQLQSLIEQCQGKVAGVVLSRF